MAASDIPPGLTPADSILEKVVAPSEPEIDPAIKKHFDRILDAKILGKVQGELFSELADEFKRGNDLGLNWEDIRDRVYKKRLNKESKSASKCIKLPGLLQVSIEKHPYRVFEGREVSILIDDVRPKRCRIQVKAVAQSVAPTQGLYPGFGAPDFSEFEWSLASKPMLPLQAWEDGVAKPAEMSVVAATQHSLEISVAPRDIWTAPPALQPHYGRLAARSWSQAIKDGMNERHNSNLWSVAGFNSHPSQFSDLVALTIDVNRVTHRDYIATNKSLGQKAYTGGPTVDQLIRKDWAPSPFCPFPPAANPLGVEYLPVTRDWYVILLRSESSGMLDTIHGWVEAYLDGHRSAPQMPNPNETVFRKAYELAGLPIKPSMIRWMGFAVGRRSGYASLLGESQVPYTRQRVNELFVNRPNKKREIGLEIVKLDAEAISDILNRFKARPGVVAALALLLWRRKTNQVNLPFKNDAPERLASR